MIQHDQIKKRGNPNWHPGHSGNPAGRPVGSRQKISENVLTAFSLVSGEDAEASLRALRASDPGRFWTIAANLLPKEVALSVTQATPAGLDPRTWSTLSRILDLIAAHAPADAAPDQVFEVIEHALRAEFAKPILPAPPY
jgi:hypothetical protein